MYSIVTIVSNIVDLKVAKGIDVKGSLHTHRKCTYIYVYIYTYGDGY